MAVHLTPDELSEALGMSLPENAAIPAVDSRRRVIAQMSGRRIVQMVKDDLKPSDILTAASFDNAVTTVLGALPGIRALRPQIEAEWRSFDFERFDRLEEYTLALLQAHALWRGTSVPKATITALAYAGPDPLASSLRQGRVGTVAVVVEGPLRYAFHDPFALAILDGLAEVKSIGGPSLSRDAVEATHTESPDDHAEFIPGLANGGEVSLVQVRGWVAPGPVPGLNWGADTLPVDDHGQRWTLSRSDSSPVDR